jgi:hypothetical protein
MGRPSKCANAAPGYISEVLGELPQECETAMRLSSGRFEARLPVSRNELPSVASALYTDSGTYSIELRKVITKTIS